MRSHRQAITAVKSADGAVDDGAGLQRRRRASSETHSTKSVSCAPFQGKEIRRSGPRVRAVVVLPCFVLWLMCCSHRAPTGASCAGARTPRRTRGALCLQGRAQTSVGTGDEHAAQGWVLQALLGGMAGLNLSLSRGCVRGIGRHGSQIRLFANLIGFVCVSSRIALEFALSCCGPWVVDHWTV